jgi:hypothetical protein
MKTRMVGIAALSAAMVAFAGTSGANEGLYEFKAVPSDESNSFYRLNTATGELNYCYWMKVEGKELGQSVCDPAGENAGPQKPGVYGLVTTNFKTDTGIFRVDKLAGKIWYCYPNNNKAVCAPPAP